MVNLKLDCLLSCYSSCRLNIPNTILQHALHRLRVWSMNGHLHAFHFVEASNYGQTSMSTLLVSFFSNTIKFQLCLIFVSQVHRVLGCLLFAIHRIVGLLDYHFAYSKHSRLLDGIEKQAVEILLGHFLNCMNKFRKQSSKRSRLLWFTPSFTFSE